MTQEEMKNDLLIAVSEIVEAISKIGSDENTTEHLNVVKSRSKRLLKNASNMLDVEDPEFKAGDIVASQIFDDGSFGLVRLNEDLTNRLTSVDGLWYIKRNCTVVDESLGVFKEDTRKATTEEIAEYEVALTFHKHDRKPFEVKGGDLIEYPNGQNITIYYPECFSKADFLNDGFKLIKTVEEVNEWLGVSDE